MDLDVLVPALLAIGILILIGFPIHEFSHAWAAYMLGDSTARWQGRLTLDPRVHFDTLGGLMLFIVALLSGGRFIMGWARPTPVNPYNLRYGRRGEALVAALGPVSNLGMALLVGVPLQLVWSDPALVATIAESLPLALLHNVVLLFVLYNAILFVFNLLPIPPLDGWKVVGGFVSARLAYEMRRVEQYGFLILLLVVFLGFPVIGQLIGVVARVFLGPAVLMPLGLG